MAGKQNEPKASNYSLIDRGSNPAPWDMMEKLIASYHPHLADARIAMAWRHGLKPDPDGHLVLGQCKKAGDLDKQLHEYDFVIVLNWDVWNEAEFSGAQQLALIDHELMHASFATDPETGEPKETDSGGKVWRIRKHDLEEFQDIVARHGCYKSDIEKFARAALEGKKRPLLTAEKSDKRKTA